MSAPTVAIPRTLVHFLDFFEWRGFFELLGCRVVRSAPSTYATFQQGFKYASNEQCFPVKLFLGHVAELKGQSDYLFIPQYVSLKAATFSCPKVIAAPLLARRAMPDLQETIAPVIDFSQPRLTRLRLLRLALRFTWNPRRLMQAWRMAVDAMEAYAAKRGARPPRPQRSRRQLIGVIGHRYALRDPQLNMGLFRKLQAYGLDFVTSDTVGTPPDDAAPDFDCPPIHWDFGQNLVHAAKRFMGDERIKGVIVITYFGCGPDSFLEEVFKRQLGEAKPYLALSLDEHTGEAGMVTRLEAFIDMMKRERKLAR